MRKYLGLSILLIAAAMLGTGAAAGEPTWKAGLAKAKITPKRPRWMTGFGHRLGGETLHDIWVKVLALESDDGHRAVVITSDVCGFSKLSYDAICAAIEKRSGLDRAQIMLTCSHTHTGPALRDSLFSCWPYADAKARASVEEYSLWLEKTIVDSVAEAFGDLKPAMLSAAEGATDFAVNRRHNSRDQIAERLKRGEPLKGPVDHSVPTLIVRSPKGDLRALVFGYACHTVTLATNQWSGDYAGFAMIDLEESHPGLQAMFYQACGADQNTVARFSVEKCRKFGQMLATAVEDVLSKPSRPIKPTLRTTFGFHELPFRKTVTVAQLKELGAVQDYDGMLARRLLEKLDDGDKLAASYPYPVQVWKLGRDQLWISLAGEVCVEYSLRFKKLYGPHTWTAGYVNDLVCYIPSERILEKGGGQEPGSLWGYGLPAHDWAPGVEDRIVTAVEHRVEQLK